MYRAQRNKRGRQADTSCEKVYVLNSQRNPTVRLNHRSLILQSKQKLNEWDLSNQQEKEESVKKIYDC